MTDSTSTLLSSHALPDGPAAPRLYLSSAPAGWTGLDAAAFHCPADIEDYVGPARPDLTLIVFAGGGIRGGQRYTDGPWTEFGVGPGGLILRPGRDTSCEVRWTSVSAVPTQTLHLRVGTALLARTAAEVADSDPTHLSLAERLGFQDPLLAQLGFALWRELAHPAPAGRLYADTAAQLLAVHLLRRYTATAGRIRMPAGGLTGPQLRRVTDFIHAHLSADLSLNALAQQVGLSPYHFARLFRQTTGDSPHHYVLRRRLERAQCLLTEPLPLALVARESGFADQSHFTRTFKRYLGLTPRAYRQAC